MSKNTHWYIANPAVLSGFYLGASMLGTTVAFYYPQKRTRAYLAACKKEVKEKLTKQFLIDNARDLNEEQYQYYSSIAKVIGATACGPTTLEMVEDAKNLSEFTASIRKRILCS